MDKMFSSDLAGKGIYCLVFRNEACSIDVGRLGSQDFKAGYHIYVGSALGQGGLKRLKRHILVSQNRDLNNPHWHVDYLLMDPAFGLVSVIYSYTASRLECMLVGRIGGERISGFGSSDCSCRSHLFYRDECPVREIIGAFSECDLEAVSIHFP